jgi:hypothetical protein
MKVAIKSKSINNCLKKKDCQSFLRKKTVGCVNRSLHTHHFHVKVKYFSLNKNSSQVKHERTKQKNGRSKRYHLANFREAMLCFR